MKTFIEKHALLLVCLLFFAGIFLRSINLWNNIIFAYDQGRDAQRIADIISLSHFKLVGPETNIPGVFNGPFFYYLLAPIYAIFRFNPNFVALFVLLANALSIFLLYYFSQILFKTKIVSVLAAFLWAISYEQANYARFLSNASFMGISALIFFLGLALYFLREKDIGLPISVIGFSLGVQFNFYLIYLAVFYPLFFILFKRRMVDAKNLLVSIGLFILFFSPFMIAELKWHFLATHSLWQFVTGQSTLLTISESFGKYIQSFAGPIYNSLFSFNFFIGFLLTVALIIYSLFIIENKKILLFFYLCFFSTLPLFGFSTGVLDGEVINAPILAFYTILYALGITWLFKSQKYKFFGVTLLIIIVLSNASLFIRSQFRDLTMFSMQPLILKDEENAIDYTYKSSHGQPFSICAVSNPLFVNTLWGYLYHWYGLETYGYLPFWSGQKQDLTESLLPYDVNHVRERYLIVEPLGGISLDSFKAVVYLEDNTSKLVEVKQFGSITVQKRTLQEEPRAFLDTQKLTPADIVAIKNFVSKDVRYTCYNSY